MSGPVLLNNVDHHDVRIMHHRHDADDHVNQSVVFPTEFEALQREYAIVFRRDAEGAYQSTVLLGLDRDENLYLDQAIWQARYIPALLQRGPFSIGIPAEQDAGEPMIQIDLDDRRVSRSEGEPLFRAQGGNAAYLDHVVQVLRTIYAGMEASKAMFASFEALDLLEPVAIEINLDDTRSYTVPDCFTIPQERLAALDGAGLERLHRGDHLRSAIWAASSLGNIARLIDLKNRRD